MKHSHEMHDKKDWTMFVLIMVGILVGGIAVLIWAFLGPYVGALFSVAAYFLGAMLTRMLDGEYP
jgi:hypothetical protein